VPLRAACVGEALPAIAIKVTLRMALAYAAGIGAEWALDDTAPDFAALPFFCVALEWQLVIAARNRALGLSPPEALRSVHAGQSSRFFRPIRPTEPVHVSGRIDILNPIHTEREVAIAAGLPDTIVQGTALWALAGRRLLEFYAPGEPQKLQYFSGRFAAMVPAGMPVVLRHGISATTGDVVFSLRDHCGKPAIADGHAAFSS